MSDSTASADAASSTGPHPAAISRAKQTANITIGALAVMNIVAVVSLRGLPAEAEYGLSSIFYYVFAAVVFLIPVSLVAAELATGWPETGGVFRWVGEAFGPRWAFLAMFMLFIEVTIWFPTVLTFGAVSLAYTGTDQNLDAQLSGNKAFVLAVVLVVYWLATFIAFRGVAAFSKVAQWGGIVGTLIPAGDPDRARLLLLLCRQHAADRDGLGRASYRTSPTSPTSCWPPSIFLFYAGMEMNAIHVKDVKNPTRNYPIAVLIAAAGTVVIFVLGTLAIAFVVPQADINLTQSLLTSYNDMFDWAGIGWAVADHRGECWLSACSPGVVTWVAGPSSGLLAVGRAGYLPRFWQHTNKHGMGTHILLFQAFMVTALGVVYVVLPSVQAAYQILSQLTVILYLVMYLLMFAAAIYLRYSQPNRPRPYRVPGGDLGMWIFGGVGFLGSLMAFVFSFIPPDQISVGSPETYVGILVGGAVLLIILPMVIYAFRKPHWKDPQAEFVPFTWQLEHKHPGTVNESSAPTAELSAKWEESFDSTAETGAAGGTAAGTTETSTGKHSGKPSPTGAGSRGSGQSGRTRVHRPHTGPAAGGSTAV